MLAPAYCTVYGSYIFILFHGLQSSLAYTPESNLCHTTPFCPTPSITSTVSFQTSLVLNIQYLMSSLIISKVIYRVEVWTLCRPSHVLPHQSPTFMSLWTSLGALVCSHVGTGTGLWCICSAMKTQSMKLSMHSS